MFATALGAVGSAAASAWSVAGPSLAVAGTGLSAYGSYAQGKAAKAEARYNQQVANQNAAALEQKTQFDQMRQQKRGQSIMGSLRAKLGASGAMMTEGAPLAVVAEQAYELALENAMIGAEGRTQAEQTRSQGRVFAAQGANAMQAGRVGAYTSLLQGFGSMYSMGMFEGKKEA